jgi:hypothetical protein
VFSTFASGVPASAGAVAEFDQVRAKELEKRVGATADTAQPHRRSIDTGIAEGRLSALDNTPNMIRINDE